MRRRTILILSLLLGVASLLPFAALANVPALGSVRYIHRGLTVQAPHHKAAHGKVKQKLYSAYHLSTKRAQLATLSFRDGSTLHINQLSDLTLRSQHATYVKQGEVVVIDNGGHHQVVTAVATVSAIGTEYDVRVIKGTGGKVTVIVTVVQGLVVVTSGQESEQVRAGQQVTVSPDGTISQPVPVDAGSVISWTAILPSPATASSTATETPTVVPTAPPTTTPTSVPSSGPVATPTFAPVPTPTFAPAQLRRP